MTRTWDERVEKWLGQAEATVETELRRTKREAVAMATFADSVRDLEVGRVSQGSPVQSIATSGLLAHERLRSADEATVKAAPHYEEDYGDTYEASLTAEFGARLTEAVRNPRTLDGPGSSCCWPKPPNRGVTASSSSTWSTSNSTPGNS